VVGSFYGPITANDWKRKKVVLVLKSISGVKVLILLILVIKSRLSDGDGIPLIYLKSLYIKVRKSACSDFFEFVTLSLHLIASDNHRFIHDIKLPTFKREELNSGRFNVEDGGNRFLFVLFITNSAYLCDEACPFPYKVNFVRRINLLLASR
jgi:hypothetical protein